MKKRISLFLALAIFMLTSMTCFSYTVGEKTIDIELQESEKLVNAQFENNVLSIAGGGRAVYQIYIPFNAVSIEFKYTAKEAQTTLETIVDNQIYTASISGSGSTQPLSAILRKGEHQIILKPDKDIEIYKITLNKENQEVASGAAQVLPAYSEFEKAVQTAIICAVQSPVIMVNGARRYVNNYDYRETPYIEDGEMYLPIHSFSRAFGYYYEEKENEAVLSKEEYTFYMKYGEMTKQINSANPVAINNLIKTINGRKYLPIRYFAELEGKTVTKKDNFYIVEYPSLAKKIISGDVYAELNERFNEYYLQDSDGKIYHVSQKCNADDNNDGSADNPFKTIAKAAEVAVAGDTVIIHEGTYYEILAPKNSGTASNPIIFKAEAGAKVVISACAELGVPVEEDDMLVYDALTDLGDGKNQIFYKQDNLTAARHPNTHTSIREVPEIENLSSLWPVQGNITISKDDSKTAISDTDLEQPDNYWAGGTLVAFTGSAWALGTAKIERSEPGKLYLTDTTERWWFAKAEEDTDYAYITDCKNAIDIPGEWAYQDGKIYIIPPEGENAETLKLEQKVRQLTIDLAENDFIRVEGIDTYGGGIRMNNSQMCMLRDGEYKYIGHYTHSMDQRDGYIDARDVFNQNGAPSRGEVGIYLGGSDNIIIDSHIAYSAGAGIFSVGKYGYIENNIISDCGYMGSYVGGIFVATEAWGEPETPRGGNTIFENSVYNSGRAVYGVSSYEQWYVAGDKELPAFIPDEVAYNDFYNGSIAARDTGTVYLHGAVIGNDRLKSKMHDNLVYNSWSFDSANNGIYYDNWMSMGEIYDNVVFYTDKRTEFRWPVYCQLKSSFPTSYASIDNWNNSYPGYVEGGKTELKSDDYPDGKRFKSGADKLSEDLTPYLNSLNEGTEYLFAKDAVCSTGATVTDGIFIPSKAGDYICFEDIDFSKGYNNLVMYYTGDCYNTGENVTVLVGDSIESATVEITNKITVKSPYKWGKDSMEIILTGELPDGVSNIYIRADECKSFGLERILVNKTNSPIANTKVGYYGDEAEIVSGSRCMITDQKPTGEEHSFIYNTFAPSSVVYRNVNVPVRCTDFLVRAASDGTHSGQIIQLRLDSPDSEVVAEISVDKHYWADYTVQDIKCIKPIEPGTYDIYLTFCDASKSSNLLWWGLAATEE